MLKQIGAILLLVVFFTQYFGYGFVYSKYISHHDCNNEVVCKKEATKEICCTGDCELKKDLDNQANQLTNKKSKTNFEKQIDINFYQIPNYTYSTKEFKYYTKHSPIWQSVLFSRYLSAIFHPPSCAA